MTVFRAVYEDVIVNSVNNYVEDNIGSIEEIHFKSDARTGKNEAEWLFVWLYLFK